MRKRVRRLLGLLALLTVLVLAVYHGLRWWRQSGERGRAEGHAVEASGVLHAEAIALSSSRGGRIVAIYAQEGERVSAGQELLRLDSTLLDGQIAVAQAQLRQAEARLSHIEAGARPSAIAVAEAQLAQARATHAAALQDLTDARALRANPQEWNMQVEVAKVRVDSAQYRLQSAIALKDAAEVAKDTADFIADQLLDWSDLVPRPQMPGELRSATYEWWQAWAGVDAATATLNDANARLMHWRSVLADPYELDAQVAISEATVAQAEAAVDAAQAQLDLLRVGASGEQRAAARSRLAQAQAALDALIAQGHELVIVAPADGVILSQAAHAGEVAAPGGTLLSMADLSEVKLTVYVAENRLGEVAVQQTVRVAVDALPGRIFEGRVTQIADSAEYTPRNVATKEGRVTTVYAVQIALPNPEALLKPGMSADATFVD
jgi:HlyD family secretion protein